MPANKRRYLHTLFLSGLIECAAILLLPGLVLAQDQPPASKPSAEKSDGSVQAQMRNVIFRFTDDVAVHINP
jgi:hypothetical protein